ncbi:PKD domain-containing protein [Tenacibaculum maritimum]|uniref:PKD domain-containing protein n=1 Tax=Tenacibaculum maritimum TaxID=107401 RepID=UPI0038765D6C
MKLKNKIILLILFLLTLTAIILAIFMPFNSRLSNLDFYIFDSNDNYHYEKNEKLEFYVNDTLAIKGRKLIWHFGNGDTITRNHNVEYAYKKAGKYLITLDVDKRYKISKYIKIISSQEKRAIDSIPKIHSVDEGYVGEELVFSSEGSGIDTWYWEFGETGTVDAYEQQVIYVYATPGNYDIKLKTNTTEYPISHRIKILPRFEKVEDIVAVDSLSLAEEDIRKRLQAIANANVSDKKVFHKNINYIRKKYICDEVNQVVVVVNDSKYNDLYSYCQGLHYLDTRRNQNVTINKVELDTFNCFKKIKVTQSILK